MIDIAGATAGSPATTAHGATNAAANAAANGAAKERARSTPVADAASAPAGPLQRTCLAVLREDWTTLALVAPEAAAPTQPLASALVEAARAYRLRPVRAVDGSGAAARLSQLQDELAAARGGDARLVVSVDDPRRSPGAAPLLVHAEAVVIVVRLGVTELRSVEELVQLVGRDRVLGCVVAR